MATEGSVAPPLAKADTDMKSPEIEYLLAREQRETAAYLDATDSRIRDVHQELAERYADAIWGTQEAELSSPRQTERDD